ncbi:MdtA/MuxA family multidrug efflux RND transporter periplasmic adaptor subunit [Pusillimonas sp. TS35]|uniref:MdtA/MuxA family multidrug efflux RND transporter periplasmic adaptor subunit n=1 Tax=Paracandidimonas lactea TaxID=2895524 RepID=UPI00136C5572|nr:MdtA/MuxA family multidrug efflux RND transporter periplasmic adaptor subunit [Paracandidimonas lactea]MYN12936.1 MdtA/MuxA family multidrug efflux RND transporter periplasmic adaptor subunit [Pusillimonas sp. TS35]
MPESRPESHDRRRTWVWLLVALLLVAGGYYWFFMRGPAQAPQNPFGRAGMAGMPVPVKVAQVAQSRLNYVVRAAGTVTAYNTVTVRSQVDGELVDIAFQEGQQVEKGGLLARIDPRSYQIALDQAVAQQKQNEAQLRNAQSDLKRYQQLLSQNSIARQQVDTQSALVQQLQGAVAADRAAVDKARLQLGYTRITAPISGRVGLRSVDVGNLVSAAGTTGLVTITQTRPIAVLFSVPQAYLPDISAQMRAGHTLAVALYDSADVRRIAEGELESVDNQIDVTTGTVRLKGRVANDNEGLFPNQFVNVHLRVDTVDTLSIPAVAVQQGSIGAFVYVLDEQDKAHIQRIETGLTDDGRIGVKQGLKAGQRVVIEGVDRLREGAAVNITNDSEATPGASAKEAGMATPATGAPGRRGGR